MLGQTNHPTGRERTGTVPALARAVRDSHFRLKITMLLPRFSLKTILAVLSACTVIFVIAGQAYQGKAWAAGVTIALASIPICLLVHAMFYGIVGLFARVVSPQQVPARTSQGGIQRSPDEQVEPGKQAD